MMLFVFLSCVHAGALREPRFSGSTQNERLNDKAIATLRVHAVVPAGATFLLRRLLAFPLVHSVPISRRLFYSGVLCFPLAISFRKP